MQMQLKVVTGGQAGKLIAVKHDKFLIGRSDECHLRPKSESISRRHCAIIHKDGRVLLIDLKSRNGTHVNDKKLDPAKAKILKDGDQIRVGKLEFIAVIEAGVGNVKKSEVKDVKEAAARVAANVDDSRYDEACALLDQYQRERTARVRAEYAELKARGGEPSLLSSLRAHPLRVLFYTGLSASILYLSVSSFFRFQ